MKTLRGLGRNSSFQKGSNGPHTVDGEAKATSSAINGAQAQKKRQTPEEVALTAKNYRLAKELVRQLRNMSTCLCIYYGKITMSWLGEFHVDWSTLTHLVVIYPEMQPFSLYIYHRANCA